MIYIIGLLLLGLLAGTLSGLIGVGGGIIIIPALVYIFGLSQHMAQGTTLALLVPPIGIFAAWAYYKHGYVDPKIALLICIGFMVGGYFGGNYASDLSSKFISKIFGFAMTIIGIKMLFFS